MDFRTLALLTLWTLLIGPILATPRMGATLSCRTANSATYVAPAVTVPVVPVTCSR
jgi:hypothetical protein